MALASGARRRNPLTGERERRPLSGTRPRARRTHNSRYNLRQHGTDSTAPAPFYACLLSRDVCAPPALEVIRLAVSPFLNGACVQRAHRMDDPHTRDIAFRHTLVTLDCAMPIPRVRSTQNLLLLLQFRVLLY